MPPNQPLFTLRRGQTMLRGAALFLLLLSLLAVMPTRALSSPSKGPLSVAAPAVGRAAWSPGRTAVAPSGQRFLGEFVRDRVTLAIADLPAHSEITLSFAFYAIATWDGNAGEEIGPDTFSVTHSGGQMLLNTTFSNYPDLAQAYPGSYPADSYPGQTGASAVGTLGYSLDATYELDFTFAHTASLLELAFAGGALQGDGDESWGLDEVVVQADGQVVYEYHDEIDPTGAVVEVAHLLADDGRDNDNLGSAVAAYEDLLAASAPAWVLNDPQQRSGAVYLFGRDPAGVYKWDQIQKLTPADGAPNDRFGSALALDATLMAVGAAEADVAGNANQGAVYLFARSQVDPNQWQQIQKLTAADGTVDDQFGRSLALRDSLLLVGAQEKAYLFVRTGDDSWVQVKKLVASDGQRGDGFGGSVAIDGEAALVGASAATIGEYTAQGAAYLFLRDQGGEDNWGEFKKITPSAGGYYNLFGQPVILADNQAIIGASGQRQVYVYGRNAGGADQWDEVQRLTSNSGNRFSWFGAQLAYANQRLVVGAANQAQVFERINSSNLWTPLRNIQGSARSGIDFGSGLAISGDVIFVGSPFASSADVYAQGAIHLFDITQPAAPVFRFEQAAYSAAEGVGAVEIAVVLDRPNPYPLTIDYTSESIPYEATPLADYIPISGVLTIPVGATQGALRVPIVDNDQLELNERLRLTLGRSPGGLASEPGETIVTILDDDTIATCDFIAHDEASLDRAIRCLYIAEPGIPTIQVTANISLTRPLPLLTSPNVGEVVIAGNGQTIDAQGHGRVLTMHQIKADVRNLTLRGGRLPQVQDWLNPNDGGAIYATTPNIGFGMEPSCALTLTNVVLTDNEAYAGGGIYYGCELPLIMRNTTVSNNRAIYGGAFSTAGGEEFFTNVFVQGSTFSGNTAVSGGAFDLTIGDGGVILQLVNSTVSGNLATESGGGLLLAQSSHDGRSEAQLINSTVANNEAPAGSGVYNRYGILQLSNSIIAGNQGGSNCALVVNVEEGNGKISSTGYNLDSDGACLPAGVRQPSDQPNGNANLAPLADNGGPTFSHALLAGSQALDAADNAVCEATPVNGIDQRGAPRFQGVRCDIGAYEDLPPVPAQTLRLQAVIDGRSQLLVRGDTVQWRHFDFAAPGRYEFANRPTVINDLLWFPSWPDVPDGENRDCNCTSAVFTSAEPLLPTDVSGLGLTLVRSRSHVQIVQLPAASNGFTLIVEFDDNAEAGSDTYIIDITWGRTLLFVSSSSSARAGDLDFRDEDILAYDFSTAQWQPIFDGSDVGVTKDVDAFSFLANGDLLLSFNAAAELPGLGAVDDSDIVRFTPTVLGSVTAGNFAWWLRGADVGLTTDGEDIDLIDLTADGRLVVSTIGDFAAAHATGQDEDLFVLSEATVGNPSSGVWRLFFAASSAGLTNEDINGLWIDPASDELYLTVKDSFAFAGQEIDSDDIFVCTLTQADGAATCTYRLFWDSDLYDYGSENLDAIHLGALPPTFRPTLLANAAEPATAEEAETDVDADDLDLDEHDNHSFLPVVAP